MPEDSNTDKIYYTIREVADYFDVNISLVRYWSNEFDIIKPATNKKGTRFYRKTDFENLKLIHHLLRERKYTIDGAKQHLKTHHREAAENYQMISSLEKVKAFLIDIRNKL